MFSNYLHIKTVPPLPIRRTFYASHRSCSSTVVSRSEDGARWALATQEYDFTISYRKGSANGNADALSRKLTYAKEQCATTLCLPQLLPDLHQHQADDLVISQLSNELQSGTFPRGRKWHQQPLQRYKQIWSQLLLKDGIVCRQYTPDHTQTNS